MHTIRGFIYFLLVVLWFEGTQAQVNPVFKSIEYNRRVIGKGKLKKVTSPKEPREDYLVDMGYDSSSIANLKLVGVDVNEVRYKNHLNDKEKVILSDCIIIGTVDRIEHTSETFEQATDFQTIAYVNVEEFLKNDYNLPKTQVTVMIVSGPTKTRVGEITLKAGEHVLLFLNAAFLMREMEFNRRPYYQTLINDPVVRFRIVDFNGKFLLRDGKITNRDGTKNLTDVRNEIKSVIKVAHQ